MPVLVGEISSSQSDVHRLYGGVVPELASREHLRNLPVLFQSLLRTSQVKEEDIDVIAVTRGPGLKGCLLMGVGFAKGFAFARGIPLVGVNHIEGHVLVPMLDNPDLEFPYLALVVSGGHTEIVEVRGVSDYQVKARTIDDAAGEAFDKSANLLGFEYPGGPELATLADTVNSSRYRLPKVMREAEGFSFSGLKTAISLLIQANTDALDDSELRAELAFAIQDSIVDALLFKLKKAAKESGVKRIVVTGGVSANKRLRTLVKEEFGENAFFPNWTHCMDNAAMVGFAAALRFEHLQQVDTLDFGVKSRWPIEDLSHQSETSE